jgi:alanyl-tRNA synthetase
LESKLEEINGIPCVCQEVSIDSNSVKDILFQLKGQYPSFVGIIGNIDGDKCGLSIIISDDLVASKLWNATQWIREVAPMIQGGGGGQPFFATAGGKNSSGIKSALSALKNKL